MIHPSAEVENGAEIGADTRIWRSAHVRSGARIGSNCVLGQGVFVDTGVVVGDNAKLQNRVSLYNGVTLEDGVFVGPHATFTNDKYPRAISAGGEQLAAGEWQIRATLVRRGASIGAAATILPGVTIGSWAMVGAGTVVTRDILDHGLVLGVPGKLVGYVSKCGRPLEAVGESWHCPACGERIDLPPLSGAGE